MPQPPDSISYYAFCGIHRQKESHGGTGLVLRVLSRDWMVVLVLSCLLWPRTVRALLILWPPNFGDLFPCRIVLQAMKAILWVTSTILVAAPLFGQTPPERPEFEVASIKASGVIDGPRVSIGVHIDGAQYHSNFFSLKDYIRIAYKVKDYQILGPDWIGSEPNTNGMFEFVDLPGGAYLIHAARRGFMTAQYGQKNWLAAGQPVVLEPDQSTFLSIRLARFSSISGRSE